MNVVFRVDASTLIGTGHVMRCLTLADALKAGGAQCRFVSREHSGHLLELIRQRGFEVHGLPSRHQPDGAAVMIGHGREQYSCWLGESTVVDAEQTRMKIAGCVVDWLVVDHYGIDEQWESMLRSCCGRLMVIDDLADRQHNCDLLLDQNLGRETVDYAGLVPAACRVLAGPRYALLRPEFAALREYSLKRRVHPQLRHILVTMGGVDKDNVTSQVIDLIDKILCSCEIRISVVMGPHAPWLKAVQEKAKSATHEIQVFSNVTDMAQLMADCDLAVGAAGSTAWERCCLGIPSIIFVLANNQREAAFNLKKIGAAHVLNIDQSLEQNLNWFLCNSIKVPGTLREMAMRGSRVVDGMGGKLVSQALKY